MTIKLNNNSLDSVSYNGIPLDTLKFNGTTVWESFNCLTGVTLVGNCQLSSDNILSNFSSSNYATIPYEFKPDFQIDSFEMQFKFHFVYDSSNSQNLYISESTQDSSQLSLYAYNRIIFSYTSSDGSNINTIDTPANSLQNNTTYWFKIVYDITTNYIYLYLQDTPITQSSIYVKYGYVQNRYNFLTLNSFYLGAKNSARRWWKGTIDLKESFIKLNGHLMWKGV